MPIRPPSVGTFKFPASQKEFLLLQFSKFIKITDDDLELFYNEFNEIITAQSPTGGTLGSCKYKFLFKFRSAKWAHL